MIHFRRKLCLTMVNLNATILLVLIYLFGASADVRAQQLDFGGMYGMSGPPPGNFFNNPSTNAPSCLEQPRERPDTVSHLQ